MVDYDSYNFYDCIQGVKVDGKLYMDGLCDILITNAGTEIIRKWEIRMCVLEQMQMEKKRI